MTTRVLAAAALFAGGLFAQGRGAAPAQAPAPVKPLTSEQGDAILNELRQIRQLLERLERPAAPAPEPTPTRGSMKFSSGERTLGDPKAPVTLVEFTDYQCPFCKEFHSKVLPALKRDFIDTGKLRFVTRDLPLDFHQHAQIAAEAARCAGEQGKFWQMRDLMFQNSPRLAVEDLTRFAVDLGLNKTLFQSCLSDHKFEVDVRLNLAQAASMKIAGTPSFLIGPTGPDGVEGEILEGMAPAAVFAQKIAAIGAPAAR